MAWSEKVNTIVVTPEMNQRLKICAAIRGISVKALTEKIVEEALQKLEKEDEKSGKQLY